MRHSTPDRHDEHPHKLDIASVLQALLFVTRSAPAISPEEVPTLGPEYPSPTALLRLQV